MSAGRPRSSVSLTLVSASAADDPRKDVRAGDWWRLMARAQDGDREAYRALLEGITPYIRSLAARCFKLPSDVEDAVQDVLLTVHMVRHAYDPGRPFGPWLVTIANRRIIDRLRRDTRRRAREVALSVDHETFADPATNLPGDGPDEAALVQAIERRIITKKAGNVSMSRFVKSNGDQYRQQPDRNGINQIHTSNHQRSVGAFVAPTESLITKWM